MSSAHSVAVFYMVAQCSVKGLEDLDLICLSQFWYLRLSADFDIKLELSQKIKFR